MRILVVQNEPYVSASLRLGLDAEGFTTVEIPMASARWRRPPKAISTPLRTGRRRSRPRGAQVRREADILQNVWDPRRSGDDNLVEVYVAYLRTKSIFRLAPTLLRGSAESATGYLQASRPGSP